MQVSSDKIKSPVEIPTSKSYANRALILGALKYKGLSIKSLPLSQDVLDLINALETLNLVEATSDTVRIKNIFPENEIAGEPLELYLGEGGTTIRFLLPMLALGQRKYIIKVKPSFKKRPIQDLFDLLSMLGAKVSPLNGENELCELQGPINLLDISVDCKSTSQVASAFLMLKSKYDFELEIKNLNTSMSYVELTKQLSEKLVEIDEYYVPVDMSSASYFIALGVIKNDLLIKNVNSIDKLQADSKIFKVLDLMGASYSIDCKGLSLKVSKKYRNFTFDVSDCLDLAPTLAFLASFCEGTSRIFGIENLVHKESNRVEGIISILKTFGVHYSLNQIELLIEGTNDLEHVKELTVADDHRMVMMASLFIKMTKNGGDIRPKDTINKSFANFFELLG